MRKNVTIGSLGTGCRFYKEGDHYDVMKLNHWAMYDIFNSVMLARDMHGTAVLFQKDEQVQIEAKSDRISTLKAGTKVKYDGVEYVIAEYTTANNSAKCLFRDFVAAYVDQDTEVELV